MSTDTLAGTTQNDIVKEYLSRGTYIFPPGPSLRLTVDTIAYTVRHAPKWNPINVCSYHLQEAGATPVQESPTRWPPPSACSTVCAPRARSTTPSCPPWSVVSASS